MQASGLRCVNCGKRYSLGLHYHCEECDFPLDVFYDPPSPSEPYETPGKQGIWRFETCMPSVRGPNQVSLGEGHTPLIAATRLGAEYGLPHLFLKNEGSNPTGSFKDRPNSVGVSVAKSLGVEAVVMSSTGNAGASLAAYGARAGLRTLVVVTEQTPPAKLTQMIMHGARIVVVRGSLSDAYWLALHAAREWKWMDLTSTFLCPYTTEGNKTVAYELFGQLGRAPDVIVVPVSVGPLLVGTYKGFEELRSRGLVDRLPRMVAAQSEACAPIAAAFAEGRAEVLPWEGTSQTVAGGIADPLRGYERDGTYTLRVVRESGGCAVASSDQEIVEATRGLARREGVFSEPTGAVGVAALAHWKRQPQFSPDQTIVCLVTGHGLKQVRAFDHEVSLPRAIDPTLDDLRKSLEVDPAVPTAGELPGGSA
jgi:threonine synthase